MTKEEFKTKNEELKNTLLEKLSIYKEFYVYNFTYLFEYMCEDVEEIKIKNIDETEKRAEFEKSYNEYIDEMVKKLSHYIVDHMYDKHLTLI